VTAEAVRRCTAKHRMYAGTTIVSAACPVQLIDNYGDALLRLNSYLSFTAAIVSKIRIEEGETGF